MDEVSLSSSIATTSSCLGRTLTCDDDDDVMDGVSVSTVDIDTTVMHASRASSAQQVRSLETIKLLTAKIPRNSLPTYQVAPILGLFSAGLILNFWYSF